MNIFRRNLIHNSQFTTYHYLVVFFLLFLAVENNISAQSKSFYFKAITKDNGLSSNRVNCVYEDKTGFIWLGTQDGLNRYDGYDFEIFKYNPNDSNSISDNRINVIIEEKETGNLWIGTSNGLNYFDRSINKFVRYMPNANDKNSICNRVIYSLIYDNNNNLWIGAALGLNRYNGDGSFTVFMCNKVNPKDSKNQKIYSLCAGENDNIWVGTNSGLISFNTKNNDFKHHSKNDNLKNIYSIYQRKNNDLWIGTYNNGLFLMKNGKFDSEMVNYTKENGYLLNNRVQAIVEDHKENLYIADRDGGLLYFDVKNNIISKHIPDTHNPNSINSKALISIAKSTSGIIWIGTYNSGVNYIDNKRKQFEHYTINFREDGLYNKNIRAVFQDKKDNIWIGTKEGGGLSKFNRDAGTFVHYKPEKNNPFSLNHDYVFAIGEIDAQHLLVGTFFNGLDIFNKQTKRFIHNIHDENNLKSISDNRVYSVYNDEYGVIWIGTDGKSKITGKLNIYQPDKGTFKAIEKITNARCFYREDENNIWIGTNNRGLFLYNISEDLTELFVHNIADSTSINSDNITALNKDSKGKLWIATAGGGINCMDTKSKKLKSYTVEDGLPSNRVLGLLIDQHDNIWVSTANGLSKYNQTNHKFRNFDVSDGLQGNEFETYVALKTKNGEMLFGGRNGFNIFHPDSIRDNTEIPKVVITDFKIFNKPVVIGGENSPLTKHISQTKTLILNYKQSVITFEFVALNYTSPEKNEYAYRLEGLESEWNYSGTKRTATYTSLPAGNYNFHVKASNNDKYWNGKGVFIEIIVLPPFWQTWWFRSLIAILVLGGTSGLLLIRLRVIRIQKEELEVLVDERTKELQLSNVMLEEKQEEILQQNEEMLIINSELNFKNDEIVKSHKIVDAQNQNIKGSIRYARTIQQAVLPSKDKLDSAFNNFITYKAKDIVSGDFYWFTPVHNEQLTDSESSADTHFVAVVDCTGHGVPGAFMSLIGTTLLNEIVRIKQIYKPEQILETLNTRVKFLLKQDETNNDDGMDVCLCKIEKLNDSENNKFKVTYSGAKRPLYVYQQKENKLLYIKGSVKSVGGKYYKKSEFLSHEIILDKGDIIYLTSDGFGDQCNMERKNFGSIRFKSLLDTIGNKSVNEQKNILEKTLSDYQQNVKQRDDITVLGIKL